MRSSASICCVRLRQCLRDKRSVPIWLLEDTIEALQRVDSCGLVREHRDGYIRRAAALLPVSTGTKLANKARALLAEARALRRSPSALFATSFDEPPTTVRDAMLAALLLAGDDMPDSLRQFRRILSAGNDPEQ